MKCYASHFRRVDGEVLTGLQESRFLKSQMPQAVGTPHVVSGTGWNPVGRHGMNQMIDGIEEQKKQDQATILNVLIPG
ncbi:hypothetical protein [Paraburkholderia sp. J69-2]|uniref:hypothetical protein n=1 Tax=Paraburkholderia sp. J69-2 TaxID=2805437 RepID=UPI002AB1C5E8|nr:hypothetical protein [Paraburkholderia sp. J69-2]